MESSATTKNPIDNVSAHSKKGNNTAANDKTDENRPDINKKDTGTSTVTINRKSHVEKPNETPANITKVRLVRCPKCENIHPELADCPVYRCGGRGASLRAKVYTATSYKNFNIENVEWLLVFTTLVLEVLSAVFEQLGHALLGMVIAIIGFLICITEIIHRARIERVSLEWKDSLPWIYSNYPNYKLFGTTVQFFGLVTAIWQCFHSSMGYFYARKNSQNPIKLTITMFLFSICLLISKIMKKYSTVHGEGIP